MLSEKNVIFVVGGPLHVFAAANGEVIRVHGEGREQDAYRYPCDSTRRHTKV